MRQQQDDGDLDEIEARMMREKVLMQKIAKLKNLPPIETLTRSKPASGKSTSFYEI